MWGVLLLAGLLDVTVRRDADKQTLLAEVRIRILAHARYTSDQHMRATPAHARYTSTCALHQHMRYTSTCALHQHMRTTPAHALHQHMRATPAHALHQHMRATPAHALHQHMRATPAHARYTSTGALHQHMTDATFINIVYPPRGSGTVSSYSRTRA